MNAENKKVLGRILQILLQSAISALGVLGIISCTIL
jgi:hypothetical protein